MLLNCKFTARNWSLNAVACACDFKPFTEAEQAVMKAAQEAMSGSNIVQCTGCNYCAKVCPQGIGISGSINALNYLLNTEDAGEANHQLGFVVFFNQGKKLPNECIKCGACESACPQNIPIIECLERVTAEIMPAKFEMEQSMKE